MSEETLKIGKKKVSRPRKVKEVPERRAYSNCGTPWTAGDDCMKETSDILDDLSETELITLGIEGLISQSIEVLRSQRAIVRNQIILGCTVFLNAISVLLLAYLEKHS